MFLSHSCVIDLHGASVPVASVALRYALGEMQAARSRCSSVRVITGRGNHVLADGRRGVLRREVAALLAELGVPARPDPGNEGCLVIEAAALRGPRRP